MNIQQPALIFSAWQAAIDTEQNRKNVAWFKLQLKQNGVQYAIAQGSYHGELEPALVVIDTDHARGIVQRLCRLLKQESILAIDANRHAQLETCDGLLIESLGILRNVPENVARACDSWSRVGERFYTTDSLADCDPTTLGACENCGNVAEYDSDFIICDNCKTGVSDNETE